MRWIVVALVLFAVTGLSACGTVSSSSTTLVSVEPPASSAPAATKSRKGAAARDYGAAPGEQARATIEHYMQQSLQEPGSAQYRYVNAPVKGSHGGWSDTPVAYGYVMCVWINALNGAGQYSGEQLNFFLIRNDEVIRASSNANWLCKPYMQ